MAEHKWVNRSLPPDALRVLAGALPEGSQFYELRTFTQRRSFHIAEYDAALTSTKILKKVLPNAALFYCWVEAGEILEDKIY